MPLCAKLRSVWAAKNELDDAKHDMKNAAERAKERASELEERVEEKVEETTDRGFKCFERVPR